MLMGFLYAKFRESLGAQVFFTFTVLIFFICVSFIGLHVNRQHTTLVFDWEQNGKLLANILAYQSRIGVFSENEEILKAPVESLFQQGTILEAAVYNADGKLILREVRARDDAPSPASEPGLSAEENIFSRMSDAASFLVFQHEDTMVVWAPVMSGSTLPAGESPYFENGGKEQNNLPMGYVGIILDKSPLKRQYREVIFNAAAMGIGFLALGALVTYFLATRISRPLKQLTEGIRKFARKEEHEKLSVETPNEIGKLAQAFNKMAEDLDKRETEKCQLEQQLRQTQKMEAIGTLAGGIAHDFNNILGIISGYSELASIDAPEGSRISKCLKEIFTAGKRARDLVQQILTFSRQGASEPKPLQIGLAVKEVMKMLRATLPSTIEVKYTIPRKLPAVVADPIQIHQVVMNLCTNAAHAMREKGGRLEVSLEEVMVDASMMTVNFKLMPGRYQKLKVSDTGHGMPSDVIERIFDPFFSTKEPGEGTGLGLSVVHGIVKKHGGDIDVKSTPEEGTTFEVYFPSIEQAAEEPDQETEALPTGNERVLLVDDETAMAEMEREMLESLGYKVTARTNSVEAFEVFSAQPDQFDLVITDMTMPLMTGAELSRKILKLRPNMPIVLCTGFSEKIQEETAKSIGVREFLMKPIILRDIAQIIRRALDSPQPPKETAA